MRLRQRQRWYGAGIGVFAFLCGLGIIHLLIPAGTLPEQERWVTVVWVYLGAQGVQVSANHFDTFAFGTVNIAAESEIEAVALVTAGFICILGSVLVNEAVSATRRFKYVLKNSAWFLAGYLPAGVAAFALSGARPGLTLFLFLIAIFGAALAVGSRAISAAVGGIPLLGIASIGTILLIGLVLVVAGFAVIAALGPLVLFSTLGVLVGAGITYVTRQLD